MKNLKKKVANHRARRLKCNKIADLCCGIDEGVLWANLVNELIEKLGKNLKIYKQKFLTSDNLLTSNFFKNSFEVLEITNKEFYSLANVLNKHNAKKVVLRGRFSENKQLNLKKKIENELKGEKKLHVFIDEKAIVCRNLDF